MPEQVNQSNLTQNSESDIQNQRIALQLKVDGVVKSQEFTQAELAELTQKGLDYTKKTQELAREKDALKVKQDKADEMLRQLEELEVAYKEQPATRQETKSKESVSKVSSEVDYHAQLLDLQKKIDNLTNGMQTVAQQTINQERYKQEIRQFVDKHPDMNKTEFLTIMGMIKANPEETFENAYKVIELKRLVGKPPEDVLKHFTMTPGNAPRTQAENHADEIKRVALELRKLKTGM